MAEIYPFFAAVSNGAEPKEASLINIPTRMRFIYNGRKFYRNKMRDKKISGCIF